MSMGNNHLYDFGHFRLDPSERSLWREHELVALPPKAFDLLVTLVEHPNQLLEKDFLLKAVWPDSFVEENNLADNISKLRKVLGSVEGGEVFIETVPKRGYRFVRQITKIEKPPVKSAAESSSGNAVPRRNLRPQLVIAGFIGLTLLLGASGWLWSVAREKRETSKEVVMTPLTDGGDVYGASLSPDGRYLAYVTRDHQGGQLWLRETSGGQPVAIGPALKLSEAVIGTTFSTDGLSVYFTVIGRQEPAGVLYKVNILGGPAFKILEDIDSPPAFAPDGSRFAFVRVSRQIQPGTSSLVVSDTTGNNERIVSSRTGREMYGRFPSWSPDGREIACQLLTSPGDSRDAAWELVGVDVRTGISRPLTDQKWEGCGRIAWLADCTGLFLSGTRKGEIGVARDPIWFVPLGKGEPKRVTVDNARHSYESLSISADNQNLLTVALNSNSQIWKAGVTSSSRLEFGKDAIQLTSGTAEGRAGLVALSDGRIVFGTRLGQRFLLRELGSEKERLDLVAADLPYLEELTAPVSGEFFIFSSNQAGNSHLFRINRNGSRLIQLTTGASREIDSDCSPDGHWIVYSSVTFASDRIAENLLWKIPADGGTPQQITDYPADSPHFSPDGKWISFTIFDRNDSRQKMGVIPSNGGPPVKVFALPDEASSNLGVLWTSDGKALTYIVTSKYVSNIWAQPLDGSQPYAMTKFASGIIYRYAFSRDGRNVFLSRGHPTNDAVLIKSFN